MSLGRDGRRQARAGEGHLREMGGAPKSPALWSHFLVRIVKPSGCHCTDALGGGKRNYRRVPTPLRSTSPFSIDIYIYIYVIYLFICLFIYIIVIYIYIYTYNNNNNNN